MDELLQDFLTETSESLANIDNDLVTFEQTPDDPNLIKSIFRMVHTIKGTCGFIGLSRLGHVAHAGENVLGAFRDGVLKPDSDNIGAVLEAIDCIKAIVAGIEKQGSEPAGDDTALIERLNSMLEGNTEIPDAPVAVHAVVEPSPVEESPVVVEQPVAAAPVIQQTVAAQADAPAAAANAASNSGQTVRVSISLLETLMTAVSELVLTRNQLVQGIRDLEIGSVKVPLQRLSQIVSELQEGVMKTRMQQIGNAWQKLPRLIRDLSHECGKKIDLQLIGQETEVDRQVLEIIKDPLTHMVRNSADHGLETPGERLAAGKPETGRITISACHQGGYIVIEVGDDGRGLNSDRIRTKIVEKGLASEAAAAQLTDPQLHRYIFDAGFSTAAKVTAVSGRGVGMDVVRTNIEKIGGSIDLTSRDGVGTTFTIRIPLTLAIASALIIETAGERFAVPQVSVLELVMISANSEHKIEKINNAPILRLRDRLLPLMYLGKTLELTDADPAETSYVLILQAGHQKFGVVVDRVLDTEEIVVKPVAPILKDLSIYSGNTILGDGSVVMILDPNGLAAGIEAAPETAESETQSRTSDGSTALTRVLLFEAAPQGPVCAIPLSKVDRIENLKMETTETAGDRAVVQYRGSLMPLVQITNDWMMPKEGTNPTLVFGSAGGPFGVVVHRILDIVESDLKVNVDTRHPSYLGTAILAEKATEIVDIDYLARNAWPDATTSPSPMLFKAAA
jgi:two-component system, chemotaxis family, sensor kinase CheA